MGTALPSGHHYTEELCNYIQLFPDHNYILNRFPSDNFIYIFRSIFANFTSIPFLKQQRGISGPLKALRETRTMPKKGGLVSGGSDERGWWEVCNTLVWHKSLTGRCTLQSIYFFNLHCIFWLKKQKLWSGFLETYQCLETWVTYFTLFPGLLVNRENFTGNPIFLNNEAASKEAE